MLLKITMGTRKDFSEYYPNFRYALSKMFVDPVLGQKRLKNIGLYGVKLYGVKLCIVKLYAHMSLDGLEFESCS